MATFTVRSLALAALGAIVSHAMAAPSVVAKVNGEPISQREFQRMLKDPLVAAQANHRRDAKSMIKPGAKSENEKAGADKSKELERIALKKLVQRHLLLQEAGRRQLSVSENEIHQANAVLKQRFADFEAYMAWLRFQDLADEQSLREGLRTEILLARVAGALSVDVPAPSADQLKDYYDNHTAEFKTRETVRLEVMALKDERSAQETMQLLKKGKDFGRLARERSTGFAVLQGGDLGYMEPKNLPPVLSMATASAKVGELLPVETGVEFLIVRVKDRQPERVKPLEEAQPEVEKRVLARKQQELVNAWLSAQEKKAKIEMFL